MKQINFDLSIDTDNAAQVDAMCVFLKSLNAASTEVAEPKKTRKSKAQVAEETPAGEALKPTPEPEPDASQEPDTSQEPEISITEVRTLLAKKTNAENKPSLKAKLNELGAPNVTKLDPLKYAEFVDFLNSLD
jgi:hypothetical protein